LLHKVQHAQVFLTVIAAATDYISEGGDRGNVVILAVIKIGSFLGFQRTVAFTGLLRVGYADISNSSFGF
jgi:hypothetical protein